MTNFFQFLPKKTRLLIIFLLAVILVLVLIRFFQSNKNSSSSTPPVILFSPIPSLSFGLPDKNQISALQKTRTAETTVTDFLANNKTAQKKTAEAGEAKYSLPSAMTSRPNEVMFKEGKAAFERTILLTDDASFKYPKAQQLIQSFGKPEKIIRGSKFYGSNVSTYIYPNTGLSFIAEEGSGNIFEIQTFIPTSLDQYMKLYGQDIQEIDPGTGGVL